MPRSRAAAETWAKGMNIVGPPATTARYSHRKLLLRSASRRLAPGIFPLAALWAEGARLSSSVAPRPMISTPSASPRSAPRHCSQAIALAATSGTTSVPAPMPALAMPAARPRRRMNQGCTQAIEGEYTSAMPTPMPTP